MRISKMNENLKTEILNFMQESPKKSFSTEELAQVLSLTKSDDFKVLVQTIAEMERKQQLIFNKKGKIKLPAERFLIEGTFRSNERGFGFVTIDEEEDDVYIAKEDTNFAMNGDIVCIDMKHPAQPLDDKGAEGKVVEIKE